MVDKIRQTAAERGWSLRELERQAGVATGTIYRWDDSKPSAEKLLKVAKALEVSMEELMEEDPTDGAT